jgi:hypothetical protein
VTRIKIAPEWWDECRAIVGEGFHNHAIDPERMVKGLLAERAVIEYLLTLADDAVTWLARQHTPEALRSLPAHKRPHLGDIRWRGHELDVKLASRRHEHLIVKMGAQHLPHVVVEWAPHPVAFRVLGVILANQPETFNEPANLVNPATGETFQFRSNNGFRREVRGWLIPRNRLRPVTTLIDEAAA